MDKVSVLLASSHKSLCQSLQTVLENEDWIQVVGTSASSAGALELAKELAPQVVVLDIELEGDGLEAGRRMLEISPAVKVIVLSTYDYVGEVTVKATPKGEAPELAEVDWLSKKSSLADLLKTISATKRSRRVH